MSSAPEVWTIERILKATQDYFAGRGIVSARLDSELLLVEVLKIKRIQLYTSYDRPLTDPERDAYRALVKRRAAHEPVAYILGSREFYGRPFAVNRDVLIPRPETEHLVDAVLKWLRENEIAGARVLDVGTGSGAIAVTLALEMPGCNVVATDISAPALAVARGNAATLGATVDFREADLVQGIAGPFDVVVANLPYIGEAERAGLAPDVRDHEPAQALFSGADGLNAIRRLVVDARKLVGERGLLALEMGAGQGNAVRDLMRAAGWGKVAVEADLAGHPRVVVGQLPS
jgi:release factor glutamine methyltransferase